MRLELNLTDIFKIRSDFDIEVYKITQSLITALAALQQFDLSSPNRFISDMDVSLDIEGVSVKELEESTEQLIYRGWITMIIRIWDLYRAKMAEHGFSEVVKSQQIQQAVMGDLNKIRNTFIHGSDIVSEGDSHLKNCEVLKWFKPGDRIIFTILHVFEFLHRFGLLKESFARIQEDSGANQSDLKLVWFLKKDIVLHSVTRRVVSLHDSGITEGKPERRFVSILFDNGLFGSFNPRELNINSFKRVEIVNGNLKFDHGTIIKSRDLYRYLVRRFPPTQCWELEWEFKATENTELKIAAPEISFNISSPTVIVVDTEKQD